jgi:hypothetical protein
MPHGVIHIYTCSLQAGNRATLDQLPFTTSAKSAMVNTDNSVVFEEYVHRDTGHRAVCYGRIQTIVELEMYPQCPDTLRLVLIECDWYSPTGVDTPSGLLQVSYDEQLSTSNRWTFLHNMHRSNVVLWPSYSRGHTFAVIPRTFVVIEHTLPVRDPLEDDDHEDLNDGDD